MKFIGSHDGLSVEKAFKKTMQTIGNHMKRKGIVSKMDDESHVSCLDSCMFLMSNECVVSIPCLLPF